MTERSLAGLRGEKHQRPGQVADMHASGPAISGAGVAPSQNIISNPSIWTHENST